MYETKISVSTKDYNIVLLAVPSRVESGVQPAQITGARRSGKGPVAPNMLHNAFVFLGCIIIRRLQKLSFSDLAKISVQKPERQCKDM